MDRGQARDLGLLIWVRRGTMSAGTCSAATAAAVLIARPLPLP